MIQKWLVDIILHAWLDFKNNAINVHRFHPNILCCNSSSGDWSLLYTFIDHTCCNSHSYCCLPFLQTHPWCEDSTDLGQGLVSINRCEWSGTRMVKTPAVVYWISRIIRKRDEQFIWKTCLTEAENLKNENRRKFSVWICSFFVLLLF